MMFISTLPLVRESLTWDLFALIIRPPAKRQAFHWNLTGFSVKIQ